VNLGYVINVVENERERAATLRLAWQMARQVLIVSARLSVEASTGTQCTYGDGYLTQLGTFQKYYEQEELRYWIDTELQASSVAAAPGTFYVFRDNHLKQSFLSGLYRRRVELPLQLRSESLFEQHKSLLSLLGDFFAARGRLPVETEFELAQQVKDELGSFRRAFDVIRRVTGHEQWDEIARDRAEDLLIYLALARFTGRPMFSKLPSNTRHDVRAFFSTYSRACIRSDELLFSAGDLTATDRACKSATIGKVTPSSLYIHRDALGQLPPILRVYEGCARALVGEIEAANIVKLHRGTARVSYLSYPHFDEEAHPILAGSLIVDLRTRRIHYREFKQFKNPFILHRKEEIVPHDYPNRAKFARLTRSEEAAGLYENPELIGTRDGWEDTLARKEFRISGHRLLRR
jgi:DNA phosphorothioation-associated putative methyltransferase